MAITAQLFDGTTLEFPDDTEKSVIQSTVKRITEEKQIKPDTGFTGAFKAGKENVIGSAYALAGRAGLMDTEEAEKEVERRKRRAEKVFQPTQESFTEAPVTKIKELLGGSLPYVAAPVAGAALGAVAGPAAIGGVGAATIGSLLAGTAQYTGTGLQRQMEEGKKLSDTNLLAAGAAAVPSAILDRVGLGMIPGIRQIFGAAGKEISESVAKKLAEKGLMSTIGSYTLASGKAMGVEGVTETAQQFLERLQAGLNLTDKKARDEYFDSFIGGAVLGGTLAVPGTFYERNIAKAPQAPPTTEGNIPPIPPSGTEQPNAPLLLAAPAERYIPPETTDPLLNPLGAFTSADLSPKEVTHINSLRKEAGKPRLPHAFSIEDIADSNPPVGVMERLIAHRTGYTGEETKPQTVLNIAAQRGIDTATPGFKDFLMRSTGASDLATMSPPQLFAAAKAMENVQRGEDLNILQAGISNARHYTADQYNDAVDAADSAFKQYGKNQALGRGEMLKTIGKATGLTNQNDQARILERAVAEGHLERIVTGMKDKSTGETRPVESFKPATGLTPLPGGMDIREEMFKRGEEPAGYEVMAGGQTLSPHATEEEAVAAATQHQNNRMIEAQKIQNQINGYQNAVNSRNEELTQMQSVGQGTTHEFFTKSADYYAKNQIAQQAVEQLKQQQAAFVQPVGIKPMGMKPIVSKQHTLYEKGEEVGRFESPYQAEEFGMSRLSDKMLKKIIDSAPAQRQTGRVQRYVDMAQKELYRRKEAIETGTESYIKTKQGIGGSEERLAKLGIYSNATRNKVDEIHKNLYGALKRFGLEKVGLRIVHSIEDGRADGTYVKNLITIAMDSESPMGTLRHETIHALKELGAFTAQEWRILTNKAKTEWVNKYLPKQLQEAYKSQYLQENGNLRGFDEYLQEEGIAEAFKHFATEKPPAGFFANMFMRLKNFFQVLKSAFNKAGLPSAEAIFGGIEEGAYAPEMRQAREEARQAARPKYDVRRIEKDVNKRTMVDLELAIPTKNRVVSKNPTKLIDGKPFSQGDLNETGYGFLTLEEFGSEEANRRINDMWKQSIEESGGQYVKDIVDKLNAKPPTAEFINNALSLPNSARYWYELSGEKINDLPLPAQMKDMFINFVSGTSGNAKPLENMRRAISAFSEYLQNKPINTDLISKKTVENAIRNPDLETLKFGNFAGTMKYVSGMTNKAPITTNDRQVAAIFNMDPADFVKNQALYEVISRFYNKLRDEQNSMIPKDMQPYEAWQLQALSWVEQRAEETSYKEKTGDDYAQAIDALTAVIRDAGLPLSNDKIGLSTLKDPRLPTLLSKTIEPFQNALKATVESNTLLNTYGLEANAEYEKIKNVDEPWAKKLATKFERIQRKAFEDLRAKGIIQDLASVIVGRKANMSRIDTDSYGTFEGALSPNMRIPLYFKDSANNSIQLTDKQAEVFLAILNDQLDQAAGAASLFKPTDGPADTYRLFFPNKDLTTSELDSLSKELGFPLNIYQEPNGSVVEINVGGFDTKPDAESIKTATAKTFGDIKMFAVPTAYKSLYITKNKEGDWAQSYKEVVNGFRNSQFRGSEKDGLRKRFNAGIKQSSQAIRAIAKERDKKFAEFTEESRAERTKRNKKLKTTETVEFKQWFEGSKVVDEDGKPLLMYHSTKAEEDFDTFDTNKSSYGGTGSWFSNEPYNTFIAGQERGRIIPAFLSLKNPAYEELPLGDRFDKKKLMEQGYDGVLGVHPHDKHIITAVAFKPEQIKSAFNKEPVSSGQKFSLALGKLEPTTFLVSDKNPNNTGDLAYMPDAAPFPQKPIRLPVGTHDEDTQKGYGANHILRRAKTEISHRPVEVTKEGLEDTILQLQKIGKEFKRIYRSGPNLVLYDPITDDAMFVLPRSDHYEVQTMYSSKDIGRKFGDAIWSGRNVQPSEPMGFTEKQQGISVKASPEGRVVPTNEPKVTSAYRHPVMTPTNVEEVANTPRIKGTLGVKRSLRGMVPQDIEDAVNRTTTGRDERGFVEKMMDAISPHSMAKIRQALVNKYEAIERLSQRVAKEFGNEHLLADTSAIAAALQSDRAAGVAAASFRDGIPVFRKGYTFVSNENGKVKGLIETLQPLMKYDDPKIFQYFQFYAGTVRGKRLLESGKEKTFTPEDIKRGKELANLFPEFPEVFREYQIYNQGLVQYMKDTGVISDAEAKTWTENWDYIPFYRQMEGEDTVGPKVFSGISGVAKPKALKGSEYFAVVDTEGKEIARYLDANRANVEAAKIGASVEKRGVELADFMETIVRNARAAIEAGMKNEASRRVVRDIVQVGMGEKVPLGTSGTDIVNVKENGVTAYYRVADPLLVEALKGLNLPQLPFLNILAAPANLLRNFVTKDPGFILANLGRDSMQAWITSGVGMTPLVDTFKQFGKTLANQSPEANAMARAGLTGYDFAGDVKSSARQVEKELRKRSGTRTKTEQALLPLTSFWEMLDHGSHASDMATRAEVYKRTLERTGSEAEALYQAMEVLNFSRKGNSAVIRIMSAMVPFFNARVQGLDILYRSGWGKMAMENKEAIQKAFMFRSLTLLGLSVMYWAAVSDDDEYKKLTKEERDNYWIAPGFEINGKPFRFPIPFELGVVFKVIPERILEYNFGTDTGKDLRDSLLRNAMSTLSFNPIPQAVLPIVENIANYSFFTGDPIVSQGMQGIAPQFQANQSTSQLSKTLAASINSQLPEDMKISPIKVDNFIRGYTGTMGTYATMMIDSTLTSEGDPAKATKRLEQLPVIKRFFATDTGTIAAFYDLKSEVDIVVQTVNNLARTGNQDDLKEYLKDNQKLYGLKNYVNVIDQNMKQLNNMTKIINQSKTMDGDEKRVALDRIHDAQIKLTERIRILKKQYE